MAKNWTKSSDAESLLDSLGGPKENPLAKTSKAVAPVKRDREVAAPSRGEEKRVTSIHIDPVLYNRFKGLLMTNGYKVTDVLSAIMEDILDGVYFPERIKRLKD